MLTFVRKIGRRNSICCTISQSTVIQDCQEQINCIHQNLTSNITHETKSAWFGEISAITTWFNTVKLWSNYWMPMGHQIWMFGRLIEGPTYVFCDNKAVMKNESMKGIGSTKEALFHCVIYCTSNGRCIDWKRKVKDISSCCRMALDKHDNVIIIGYVMDTWWERVAKNYNQIDVANCKILLSWLMQ